MMEMHRLTSSRFPGDSQMSHEYQDILDKKKSQKKKILKRSCSVLFSGFPESSLKSGIDSCSGFCIAKYFPPANESCLIGNWFSIYPVV